MPSSRWRERREVYLRESDRTADLVREGFINAGIEVVKGLVVGAGSARRRDPGLF